LDDLSLHFPLIKWLKISAGNYNANVCVYVEKIFLVSALKSAVIYLNDFKNKKAREMRATNE